jgi:DNA repair protein RecO (recombination protein O)
MKDPGVPTDAVVVRRFDFAESSQIARLYTREFGRVSVLAKGIRRPNADLLGPMDLGAEGEATIRPKKGDALSLLTRWRTRTGFPGQRTSLERMTAAAHVCELWCEGTTDFDPDPALYDLLVASLAALESAPEAAVTSTTLAADLSWLAAAGFAPSLDRCVTCGAVAPPNASARVAPGRGGLLCSRCVDATTPGLLPVTAAERRLLLALLDAGPANVGEPAPPARTVATLRRVVDRLLEHALEKELQSSRYL